MVARGAGRGHDAHMTMLSCAAIQGYGVVSNPSMERMPDR